MNIEQDSVSPAERAKMFDEHAQKLLEDEKFAEGKAEGAKLKAMETARRMKAKGYDMEEIVELTGLPVEGISAVDS